MLPVELAGLRIEADDALARDADEHTLPRLLDHDRRGIRNRVVQGPPALLAGDLVERHDGGAVLAADVHDHQIAFDQRRAGDPPDWDLGAVFLPAIVLPEQLAGSGLEAVQVAHRAQGVGPAFVDGDRAARPGLVLDALVAAVIGVGPHLLARAGVEALHAFLRVGPGDAVHDEHASLGDGRSAVAAADLGPPLDRQLRRLESLDEPGLRPDAVPRRSAPLRPIGGIRADSSPRLRRSLRT